MKRKMDSLRIGSLIIGLTELFLILLFKVLLQFDNVDFLVYIFLSANSLWLIYVFIMQKLTRDQYNLDISRIIGKEGKEAFDYGEVGIIVCEQNGTVTWASDYINACNLCKSGQNIEETLPDAMDVLNGTKTSIVVEYEKNQYQIRCGSQSDVLLVKNITELYNVSRNYQNEKIIEGLINLDNYNETVLYEDEQRTAIINTNIRQKLIEWATDCGAIVKRLRSNRLLLFINEQKFQKMLRSKFKILEEVKKEAAALDVQITASMVFARNYSNLIQLDEEVASLMELALSRGGDQVIVKENGKENIYFGSSSEAVEKTSKVHARVMSRTISTLIADSSNVIIVPHDVADMDALGACLGLSDFVAAFQKKAYILYSDINIEEKAKDIFENNMDELSTKHIFISSKEAKEFSDEKTLVIVVDHHTLDLTSNKRFVESAKRVVIIDHHRKREDSIKALLIYNEPSASSSVELIGEMIKFCPHQVNIGELDATIMYCGLLVDTDNLRTRCTSRSFEICAFLKENEADIALANDWLKRTMEDFANLMEITRNMEICFDNIAICTIENMETPFTRTALAQAANYLCAIKDIEAAFAIGGINNDILAISGRSNGKINVQVILERLGGGGHFNAAGLQRKSNDVNQLKKELIESISDYIQGGISDESNTVE